MQEVKKAQLVAKFLKKGRSTEKYQRPASTSCEVLKLFCSWFKQIFSKSSGDQAQGQELRQILLKRAWILHIVYNTVNLTQIAMRKDSY